MSVKDCHNKPCHYRQFIISPAHCSGEVWVSVRALAAWTGCAGLGCDWSWVKSELQWSDWATEQTVIKWIMTQQRRGEELPRCVCYSVMGRMYQCCGHHHFIKWLVMWAPCDTDSFTCPHCRRRQPAHLTQYWSVDSQVWARRIGPRDQREKPLIISLILQLTELYFVLSWQIWPEDMRQGCILSSIQCWAELKVTMLWMELFSVNCDPSA